MVLSERDNITGKHTHTHTHTHTHEGRNAIKVKQLDLSSSDDCQLRKDTKNFIWFPTMWYVRPAKAQTSLRIPADWSEPLLVA